MVRLLTQAGHLSRFVLRRLAPDLNPTTAAVLTAVVDGPRRLGDLAAAERLAQPTLTAAVIALEQRGWVRRRRDSADRRAVWVEITPAGRRRKRRLHHEAGALLRDALDRLPEHDAQQMLAVADGLALLVEALQDDCTSVVDSRRSVS